MKFEPYIPESISYIKFVQYLLGSMFTEEVSFYFLSIPVMLSFPDMLLKNGLDSILQNHFGTFLEKH